MAYLPDLTIYRHFDDFQLQKYHIDDITIYVLILTIFEIKNLRHNLCFKILRATLSFVFALQMLVLQI